MSPYPPPSQRRSPALQQHAARKQGTRRCAWRQSLFPCAPPSRTRTTCHASNETRRPRGRGSASESSRVSFRGLRHLRGSLRCATGQTAATSQAQQSPCWGRTWRRLSLRISLKCGTGRPAPRISFATQGALRTPSAALSCAPFS